MKQRQKIILRLLSSRLRVTSGVSDRLNRHRLVPLLCALLLVAAPFDTFADCDQCPKPKVILYDFAVEIPQPEERAGRGEWFALFFAGSRAGSELYNDKQCVRFLDGAALKDDSGEVGGSLIVAVDHPHLPPAGDIKGREYLFTGTVSGGPGNYHVNLSLQTACKRRIAHSASGSAATVDEANELAQTLARQELRPLLQTIRRFERDQRATNPKVALASNLGDILNMEPAKRDAKPFETVPIQFTLVDCDGEPLPGREISLTVQDERALKSYNGHFDVPKVTTGGNGKAKANFIVGGKKGVAIPRASFQFLHPTGCEGIDVDETSINVEGTAELYEVRFTYQQEKHVVGKRTETLPGGSQNDRLHEREELNMSCLGVWKNPPEAQRDGYIELRGKPVAGCEVSGEYSAIEIKRDRMFVSQAASGPGLTGSSLLHTGYLDRHTHGTPLHNAPVDLYFWYKGGDELDSSQFTISVPFEMRSSVSSGGLERITGGGKTFDTPFSDAQSDTSNTSFSGSVPDSKFTEKHASIVVTGTYESTENEQDIKTTETARIKAIITPIQKLADSAAASPRK